MSLTRPGRFHQHIEKSGATLGDRSLRGKPGRSCLPTLSPQLLLPEHSPAHLGIELITRKAAGAIDSLGHLVPLQHLQGQLAATELPGEPLRLRQQLLADAVATTAGAALGTSTTTTFVESASGVSEGGRTGLTAVTTAILFGLSLFLSPIFLAIPSFATAPALIIVGLYMLSNVISIDFSDMSEAIPCYVCIIAMPFFYSISEGISMGVITYVAINLITGKAKEKKISALMYVLAVLFILKYIFL